MVGPSEPRDVHDRLIKHVYSRKDAFGVELRLLLPRELQAHLDWASLTRCSTERTDERLRGRISDLHFSIDYVDGEQRWPLHFPLEHQSNFAGWFPLRVVVCAGEIWLEYLRDHPKATVLPMIMPILIAQHPARNTPTRLSLVLGHPPGLGEIMPSPIEAAVLVDDLSGSVLDDPYADPATLALVELARAFLYAYKNPESLTEARLAELAPLLDVLMGQDEPLATADITALWTYVLGAFEAGSPVRTMIEKVIRGRPREMYMTIAESLIAEGEAKGRAAGLAEALLRVLELRWVSIPEPVRERVSSSRDEHQLKRWLDRVLTVASAQEVLDG
jgi:hypothetical protein